MESQELEILNGALGLFRCYGLKRVTMDDVAKELGISKKTIYKYFENKADLIHKIVQHVNSTIESRLIGIHLKSTNPIDELIEIDNVVYEIVKRHNPSLSQQLKKFYPASYEYLYEHRNNVIHKIIAQNIEIGQRDGWYRMDACKEVIGLLYCKKVETIPEEEKKVFGNYDMNHIMGQALKYHVRGIATEKGLEYLEEKLMDTKAII